MISGTAVRGLAPGRFPQAPHGWQRRLPWRATEFVALWVQVGEIQDGWALSFGLAPVQAGRVVLRGARFGRIPFSGGAPGEGGVGRFPPDGDGLVVARSDATLDPLRTALDHRFLIAWSGPQLAALLERILGGRERLWLHRTVDVRRLVSMLEAPAVRAARSEGFGLAAAAEAFRVPYPRPCDALDAAVTIGTLFLVVATTLAARGQGDVRSLLWRP